MYQRLLRWLPVAPVLVALAACAHRRPVDVPAPVRLTLEVRQILNHRASSPEYYRARSRLAQMGPEVDALLVSLARDPEVRTLARRNALTLLAERGSPAAVPVLRRMLLSEPDEDVRTAAVQALQILRPTTEEVVNLVRSAVGDPSRTVRLNALQALETRDVATIRALLERETDREVRQVALQLVAIAESRGAALASDRRGALRTAGGDGDPQIVFRPVRHDSIAGFTVGDLRVELPNGPDVPLAPLVEVVGNVVPAFFSPDRSRVVYEVDREIRVVNLASRRVRSLGAGIAPRVIPFSSQFVFLRPLPTAAAESAEGTELNYAVYRADFGDGAPEWVGELRAVARMDRHANYSPARWMVVAEAPEGFVLRADGLSPFVLPAPVFDARPSSGSEGVRYQRPRAGGQP